MKDFMRFGKRLPIPSIVQIRHELRAFCAAESLREECAVKLGLPKDADWIEIMSRRDAGTGQRGVPILRICEDASMPSSVEIGQKWSVWVSGRQQWLLAAVTGRRDGRATLKYDTRYGVVGSDSEYAVDESAMLVRSNLFRFVEH